MMRIGRRSTAKRRFTGRDTVPACACRHSRAAMPAPLSRVAARQGHGKECVVNSRVRRALRKARRAEPGGRRSLCDAGAEFDEMDDAGRGREGRHDRHIGGGAQRALIAAVVRRAVERISRVTATVIRVAEGHDEAADGDQWRSRAAGGRKPTPDACQRQRQHDEGDDGAPQQGSVRPVHRPHARPRRPSCQGAGDAPRR